MLKNLFRDDFDMSGTLEHILFEKISSENINAISGGWYVAGKPDSVCVYHAPNYRFDGVTELKKETPLLIEKLFPSLFKKVETKPSN